MYRSRRGGKTYALVVGGIALIVGIIMLFGSISKLPNYEKTYATVTDTRSYTTHGRHTKTHRYATVSYNCNGQEYNRELEYKGSSKKNGDTMVIYYNTNEPRRINGTYQMWGQPISLILCGVFVIVLVILFGDKIDK